jgi:serpin B
MIPSILEEIKPEDVMYLVNALSFDAKWNTIYNETDIWKDTFTTEAGEDKVVTMLHSDENLYLEDEKTTGFIKHYDGLDYAFVALLPREGMTVAEYVESLTAEGLQSLLDSKSKTKVKTTVPKFSVDYGFNMNEILIQMGMEDAFSERNADFTQMATSDMGNIYVGDVVQKCFIAVDEYGTKAGAATAVAMANKMMLEKTEEVYLNRPFVYLIVECENFEPLFMGTVMNVEETK